MKQIFICLIMMIVGPVAQAQLMEGLAGFLGRSALDACHQRTQLRSVQSKPEPCGLHESNLKELQNLKLTENLYFSQLAAIRKEHNSCATEYLGRLVGQPNESSMELYSRDLSKKIEMLATEIKVNADLKRSLVGSKSDSKILQEIASSSARIGAIENSIQFISHPEISDLISESLQKMIEGGSTHTETKVLIDKNPFRSNPTHFQNRLQISFRNIKNRLSANSGVLEKGIQSGGAQFERLTRESLAQDPTLSEELFKRQPTHAQNLNVICEVDRVYGQGAQMRDSQIHSAVVSLTALSLAFTGPNVVAAIGSAGSLRTAVVPAFRALLGGGKMSTSGARITAFSGVGIAATAVRESIERCSNTFDNARVKGCADFTLEAIEANNCYLAATLAGLGASAGLVSGLQAVPRLRQVRPQSIAAPQASVPPKNYVTTSVSTAYHGEEKGLAQKFKSKVTYLNESERAPYRVTVKDGKIYDSEGKLYNTELARTESKGTNAIFVMDKNGDILISKVQSRGTFHHSSLVAGEPVAMAGEIKIINGEIKMISSESGHYLPGLRQLDQFKRRLHELGIDLTLISFQNKFTRAIERIQKR